MSTKTESFAERVAARYEGLSDEQFAAATTTQAKEYGSFLAIIELLLPILLEMLGNCDNSEQKVLDNARKPSRFNKVLFGIKVRNECKNCDEDVSPRKLRDVTMEEASLLGDEEGLAIIQEGKDLDYILI
jgi:hypothetical protein